jgi:signal transduction histidine kinase
MSEKILIVDDEATVEPLMQQIFRRDIRGEKLVFIYAGNGVEALAALQADEEIDVVLTDILMPKMDGITLLTKIGEMRANLNPVLTTAVMSAYDDMENIRKAMNVGAFDFLAKPLDVEDLRITMNKIVRHVQKTKHAREVVRRAQAELKHAYAELEKANQQLQGLNNLKTDFIGVITHELRSPFVNITFAAELLEHYTPQGASPEFKEQLTQLQAGIVSARRMVDNLVNFAQFLNKQGELRRQTVDVGEVIEDSLVSLREIARNKGVIIQTNVPEKRPFLLADPARLSDAIYHLVQNAIKYTEEGGEIGVSLRVDNTAVYFEVQDSGSGIPEDKLPVLWQGFNQMIDPLQQGVEGFGVGLSLVKYVVAAHDGDVFVQSQLGTGSTFGFFIPV